MTRPLALVAAALASVLVVVAAWSATGGEEELTIDVEFDRVFNLFEGSRVRVLGVDVGRVESVTVPEGSQRVIARLVLHPGMEVPEDAGAAIIQGALLGERYVQLHPPYVDGPKMENGATIPVERTAVPVEFEESFEALTDALETLDPDEVARLVVNLAQTLEGQGEPLGEMLESVRDLISTLRDSDEELVELARTLADLNETIGTRAEDIAQQYVNLGRLAESLASERADLSRTLEALLRMTTEVGDLVATHRPTLTEDLATLTRLTRTINRNLDQWERYLPGQAELFRHASRGIAPDERNWAYTRNHFDSLSDLIAQRIHQRLVGLCIALEMPECADEEFWAGELALQMCLPPLLECPEDGETPSVGEELERAFEIVPELGERLNDRNGEEEEEDDEDDPVDDFLDQLGGSRGGIQ